MRTSINVPSYYYRDYQNDFPKESEYTSQAISRNLKAEEIAGKEFALQETIDLLHQQSAV